MPDAFWNHPALRDAARAQHIGHLIAAYRHHPDHGVPITQDIVAGWANMTQAQISRIERRTAEQHLDRLSQWADLLGIPNHLLWFTRKEAADNAPWATAPDISLERGASGPRISAHADLESSSGHYQERATPFHAIGDEIPERAADVDPSLALHWTTMLNVLATSHNAFGPSLIYQTACRETAVIRRYRREAAGDVSRNLLVAEARWAEFASWTAENVGLQSDSQYWLDRANILAASSGHSITTAYVLMRRAQQSVDRAEPAAALELASQARRNPLSDRDLALCFVRIAQSHALTKDGTDCQTAIDAAYKLVANADDNLEAEDDPHTIGAHCTHSYVQAHEGYCRLRLGDAAAAVGILTPVLSAWPAAYRQDEGLSRAWLAQSHAILRDPAQAGAHGLVALRSTTVIQSARAMRVLRQVDASLADLPDADEAKNFRAAFQLAAAARRM